VPIFSPSIAPICELEKLLLLLVICAGPSTVAQGSEEEAAVAVHMASPANCPIRQSENLLL
jgi:hypothetical protein